MLAHELAHVRERDTIVTSFSSGLATLITSVVSPAWIPSPGSAHFVLAGGVRGPDGGRGARLAGDPLALARALRKIEARTVELPLFPTGPLASASHLMIVNPFSCAGFTRLFSTHPPTGEWVYRLEGQAGYPR